MTAGNDRGRVAEKNVGAEAREEPRGGLSGATGSQHGHAGAPHPYSLSPRERGGVRGGPFHRSFKEARATSARTIEMIQKRMVTLGSGQPKSSKW